MARERTPHDTLHTTDLYWPLALGVDERGASVHVCAKCGAEIPDGVLVERDKRGVRAWRPGDDSDVHNCRK